MRLRVLAWMMRGRLQPAEWLSAACQEAPVAGKPVGCAPCPLRLGGEWEAGAEQALASMNAEGRDLMRTRWGCHAAARPCSGMARLCARSTL